MSRKLFQNTGKYCNGDYELVAIADTYRKEMVSLYLTLIYIYLLKK